MMHERSLTRELALLVLGQVSDNDSKVLQSISIESLLYKALDSLMDHWREGLDCCSIDLEAAQEKLNQNESELFDKTSIGFIRDQLQESLVVAEQVLNGLSTSLEMPRLLALSNQENIRYETLKRVKLVLDQRSIIDSRLDDAMEGWRLRRLPRIDRDILRLAMVDMISLKTPPAVACNEAVELANRYSDEQGRRMINGILRRVQNVILA